MKEKTEKKMGKFAGIRQIFKRTSLAFIAFAMFAAWVVGDVALFTSRASAAQITSRSLSLSSTANGDIAVGAAGTGGNGAQATHTFNFTTSGASVGSIEFLYCTSPLPDLACTAPTGMDASTVASVGGTSATGWSLGTAGNAPTANRLRITHTAGAIATVNFAFGAGSTGTDYIKNPTTDNEEFFVRITTFSDTGWSTTVDQGSVANGIAQQIDITAKVQETLNFSVGAPGAPNAAAVPAAGTTCTPLSDDGALDLGDTDGVLSFQQAYDAYSWFRISTNANNGTLVYYSGETLEFDGESITSIGNVTAGTGSVPGTEQFGLAFDTTEADHSFSQLVANNGAALIAGHDFDYSNGDGTITSGGDARFQFDTASVTTPRPIAVATAPIVCDTGAVRYVGNIATTTEPGIYTTTLSYMAVPTY
jgi:hypothetical protein